MAFKKGKLNPKYIDGRTLKKYYCKDCGKELKDYRNKRCAGCENKKRFAGKTYEEMYGIATTKRLKQLRRKVQLGIPKTNQQKKKQSLAMGGTGIPYELTEYGAGFNNALKKQVRFKSGYKCQICECSELENGRQLDCHHIDYNKENNILNNLVSLCMSCHRKTNFNRDYWYNHFQNKILRKMEA